MSAYSHKEIKEAAQTIDAGESNPLTEEILSLIPDNKKPLDTPTQVTSEQIKELKQTMTREDVLSLLGDTQDVGSGIYISVSYTHLVYIIFPVQEVMDALGCADNKATKLFRELEKFGLIERKRRGLGKPNLIYVKNFADPRFRNRGKNDSGNADSEVQDAAKSRGNKTEWNKTEGSEPDPFSSDAEDEPDERTRLEAYFMQSLEVDLLLRVCPDEKDTIDQIVNLLVDTCSSKRRMLRVAGDDKPAEVVRSRFMKLNADHIRFVLKCLAESTAPVRNRCV